MKRRSLLVGSIMSMAFALTLSSNGGVVFAQASKPVNLTFASGGMGGAWYPLGGTVAELIKEEIKGSNVTVTTGGGIANVPRLAKNIADVGLTQSNLYAAALTGDAPYKEKLPNVRAVGYLGYMPNTFFLVPEDSELNAPEDVAAKKFPLRLIVVERNGIPELAARKMLAEYGVTYKDIEEWGGKVFFVSYAEAQTLMVDGHADAYIGPVFGAISQMINMKPFKLLPWKEEKIDAIVEKFGFLKRRLEKGHWNFVKEDVPMVALGNIFAVRGDLPDDVVFSITKAICENEEKIQLTGPSFKTFKATEMPSDVGGPLHPGAIKYYKSRGWM